MAHKPEIQAAVRQSYIFDKLSLPQAAARHGVAIGTARRWKKAAQAAGDCWDKARASAAMTSTNFDEIMASMVNDFVTLHQSLVEQVTKDEEMTATLKVAALNSLADSFSKFMKASGKASPSLNRLSFAMEILQMFGRFITDHYPEHAEVFAEVLEPFGRELAKHHG